MSNRYMWPVAAVWIGLWAAAIVAINWPGHYSVDSLIQVYEASIGQAVSFHPPFMSGLLGLLEDLTGSLGTFIVVDAAMLAASFVLLLRAWAPLTWTMVVALILLTLSPVLVVFTGIVWKDVLFANVALLGFALVMDVGRSKVPWWRIALAVALWTVAAFVRQHGFILLLVGLPSIWWLARRRVGLVGDLRLRTIVMTLVAGVLLGVLIGSSIAGRIGPPGNDRNATAWGFYAVNLFDVAGVVARDPDVPLEEFEAAGVDVAAFREGVLQYYTPDRVDFVSQHTSLGVDDDTMAAQWAAVIADSPVSYVRHRLSSFARLLGLDDINACHPFFVGVDAKPSILPESMQVPQAAGASAALARIANNFSTTLFRPALWIGLLFIVMLMAWWWRRGWSMESAMITAAILYVGAYLAIGLACDVRYSYFAILVGHAAILLVASRVRWAPRDGDQPTDTIRPDGR